MFKNLARASVFSLAAMLAVSAPTSRAQSQAPIKPPLKVAFVYVSPIGEAGWTYQHEQGRLAMQKALGDKVVSTAVEAVAEGADSERVMRDLAAQGNQLIFATSFGYLEPALRVAAEFPNVKFEHAGGYKTATNLNTYNARYYEARYLAGLLAGRTSKSGIAGYVAGFPVPRSCRASTPSRSACARRTRKPKCACCGSTLGSTPHASAKQRRRSSTRAPTSLTNHSGSPAVLQTAQANFKDKGVRAIAYQSDMRRYAPDAQLAAVTHHWGSYYTQVANAALAGHWKPQPVWGGMKDGLVQLSAVGVDVPASVQALVAARRKAVVAGSFKPFGAPLTDNEGRVRLAEGVLDDASIASMNWFVQGVVGSVPKP